jgi:hypothetical protein
MEQKTETKKSSIVPIVLAIVVIVVLAGVWYWARKSIVRPIPTPPTKPVEKVTPKEDSTAAINQELGGIGILDLEGEFKDIDQDLNSL